MSSSSTRMSKGKGKGLERRKKKRRQHHHQEEPHKTETAPHILAALEAQRARTSQQSLPTTQLQPSAPATAAATTSALPPPPPLPGYVFDPARNRYFRMVKDSLGTPGNAKTINASNTTNTRRKIKIPFVHGRIEGSTPPQREGRKIGSGASVRGNRSNGNNHSLGPVLSFTAAHIGGSTACTTAAGSVAARDKSSKSVPTAKGRGLHSYAMHSRRGLWGLGCRTSRPRGRFIGVQPGDPVRRHRAGVESIVSSSRFRVGGVVPWAHASPGAGYSAVEWDADRNVLAVGTVSGALGVMTTGLESVRGGGDRPREGFAPWQSGVRQVEERVCWGTAARWTSDQVSDIKFRTNGNEWACATSSLGSAGQPGGVNARCWGQGGQDGARDIVNFFAEARVCEKKVRRGSVWCTEWDPLTPSRLAVGPSSSSPVMFFDVEKEQLTTVAKLSGDVFSVSFLPVTAPGAGHAFVCGLRDGSVVLVDPRQSPRQNLTTTVARNLASGGGSSGRSSDSRRNAGFGGTRRSGGGRSAGTELLARLDHCSSVDHTHILRDGTRCLVKDRSGGLQSVDLRFFSGPGGRSDRGPGTRPLKVLVPPGARALARGKFALDSTETVVVTPVPAAAAAAAATQGGGGGGGEVATGGAWGAFSLSGAAGRPFPNAGGGSSSGGMGNNGGGRSGGDGSTPPAGRDRLRVLNVSSGEQLNDIQTPWTGVSLATERGAASATAVSAPLGLRVPVSMSGGGDGVRFWGTAWEPGQGATVFEAKLRSNSVGGYGRL